MSVTTMRSLFWLAFALVCFHAAAFQQAPIGASLISHHDGHPTVPPVPAAAAKEISDNINAFVKASGAKPAVLITFGDSTMAGVSSQIKTALESHGRQKMYSFSQCHGWDEGCSSFAAAPSLDVAADGDPEYRGIYNNIREAFAIMDKADCNLGGKLFIVSRYTELDFVHLHWGFGAENLHACWKPCLTDAMRALKPTAVLINQGLHLLHVYPVRTCSQTTEQVAYFDCGTNHEELVKNVLAEVSSVTPIALWKTSNWICESKYYGEYREQLNAWKDPAQKPALEKECQKECVGYSDERPCADELLDTHGSDNQREMAMRALKSVNATKPKGRVALVDAYNVTKDRCDETPDGRHYYGLDHEVVLLMAKQLATLAAA